MSIVNLKELRKFNDVSAKEIAKAEIDVEDTGKTSRFRTALYGITKEDLEGADDHEFFLSCVAKNSEANHVLMNARHRSFQALVDDKVIISLKNRSDFIYELIQNADDCSYPQEEDPWLSIRFIKQSEERTLSAIELSYNECGFTPSDICSLCDIANSNKMRKGKMKTIGHKGLGFKTVFGVSDKVKVQSGYFSFILDKKDYTLPVPVYGQNFKEVKGTVLTLYLPPERCEKLFEEYKTRFTGGLIEKNPILFLRNLSTMRLSEGDDYLQFYVQRGTAPSESDRVTKENDILIYIDHNGEKNIIHCNRYSKFISYDKDLCSERFPGRDLDGYEDCITAIVPTPEYLSENRSGTLYTHLPTRVRTTIPMTLQAPFNLDSLREYPDPEPARWFEHTCAELSSLISNAYQHFATVVGEEIVRYLPKYSGSVFENEKDGNTSIASLIEFSKDNLSFNGSSFCNMNIYKTKSGFLGLDNIYCFDYTENLTEREKICSLVPKETLIGDSTDGDIFLAPADVDPSDFNCPKNHYISNVLNKLWNSALKGESDTTPILDWIDSYCDKNNKNKSTVYSSLVGNLKESLKITSDSFIYSLVVREKSVTINPLVELAFCYAIEFNKQLDAVMKWIIKNPSTSINFKKLFELPAIEDVEKISGNQIDTILGYSEPSVSTKLHKIMFDSSFDDGIRLERVLTWLKEAREKVDYEALMLSGRERTLNPNMVKTLAKSNGIIKSLHVYNKKCIERSVYTAISANKEGFDPISNEKRDELRKTSKVSLNPSLVSYFDRIKYSILVVDTGVPFCLFCKNCIILSKGTEYSALAKMIRSCDLENTLGFTLIIEWKELDARIQNIDTSGSSQEFLHNLVGCKEIEKNIFGRNYKSLLNLIEKSGSNNRSFLSELIQNADDLQYPEGSIPTFNLTLNSDTLVTFSNECGFTPQNVVSLLDIGRTTKEELLGENDYELIGRKGIGFKTVFSYATNVEVHSGEFHFRINKESPTIPIELGTQEKKTGTEMVLHLITGSGQKVDRKKLLEDQLNAFDNMLGLCLCLRTLKKITLGQYHFEIRDYDCIREISITSPKVNKTITLNQYDREIAIKNAEALESHLGPKCARQRCNTKITCYIPENPEDIKEYHLYTGLPLKNKSKIQVIFDIPFELNNSRESYIEGDPWNEAIRKELYPTVKKLMEFLKKEPNFGILRLISEDWNVFEDRYLNENLDEDNQSSKSILLDGLKLTRFVPRFRMREEDRHTGTLVQRSMHSSDNIPTPKLLTVTDHESPSKCMIVEDFLLDVDQFNLEDAFSSKFIVDTTQLPNNEEVRTRYIEILMEAGCIKSELQDIQNCLGLILDREERISNEVFRNGLYCYIKALDPENREKILSTIPLIPVETTDGQRLIDCSEDSPISEELFYIDPNSDLKSPVIGYYVLDEKYLPHKLCEEIFEGTDYKLSILNSGRINDDYASNLSKIIDGITDDNPETIANKLKRIYESCKHGEESDKLEIFIRTLKGRREEIPTKRSDYDETFAFGTAFTNTSPDESKTIEMAGDLLPKFIIHQDFEEMALDLGFKDIREINTSDIDSNEEELDIENYELNLRDLVDLSNGQMRYGKEIIRKYSNGQIGFLQDIYGCLTDDESENVAISVRDLILDHGNTIVKNIFTVLKEICNRDIGKLVPCLMKDKRYSRKTKCVYKGKTELTSYLKSYVVDDEYKDVAKVVGYKDLELLEFSDTEKTAIHDDDIINICSILKEPEKFLEEAFDNNTIELITDVHSINQASEEEYSQPDASDIDRRIMVLLENKNEVFKKIFVRILEKVSDDIPCKRVSDGMYHSGKKFKSGSNDNYKGDLLKSFLIDPSETHILKNMTIPDIKEITYEDLMSGTDLISTKDFEDLCELDLKNKKNIIDNAILDEKLEIFDFVENEDDEVVAEYFKNLIEDKSNGADNIKELLKKSKDLKENIPCLMLDGTYSKGMLYIAPPEAHGKELIKGPILKGRVVHKDYSALAKLLDAKEITDVDAESYSDLVLSNDDIIDLRRNKVGSAEVIIKTAATNKHLQLINELSQPKAAEDIAERLLDFYNLTKSWPATLKTIMEAAKVSDAVPILRLDGEYHNGTRFTCDYENIELQGNIMKALIVDERFRKMAESLGTKNIDEVMEELPDGKAVLSNDDLEDIVRIIQLREKKSNKGNFKKFIKNLIEKQKCEMSNWIYGYADEASVDTYSENLADVDENIKNEEFTEEDAWKFINDWKSHPEICELILNEMNEVDDEYDLPLFDNNNSLEDCKGFTNTTGMKLKGILSTFVINQELYSKDGIQNVLHDIGYRDITDLELDDLNEVTELTVLDLAIISRLGRVKSEDLLRKIRNDGICITYLLNDNRGISVRSEGLKELAKNNSKELEFAIKSFNLSCKNIPIKTIAGTFEYNVVLSDPLGGGFFSHIIADKDYGELARIAGCKKLTSISAENLTIKEDLDDEDIVALNRLYTKEEDFDEILRKAIEAKHVLILSNLDNLSPQEIAKMFLEYSKGESGKLVIKHLVRQKKTEILNKIPCLMSNGFTYCTTFYTNTVNKKYQIKGSILPNLVVDDSYHDLAEILGAKSVYYLSVADVKSVILDGGKCTDADLDALEPLQAYLSIVSFLISTEHIDPENPRVVNLIDDDGGAKCDIERFCSKNDVDVESISREISNTIPHKYKETVVTRLLPDAPIGEKEYLSEMYSIGKGKSVCQICMKIRLEKYFEPTKIEPNPKEAWPQMYLNLCVNCSRWYSYALNEKEFWNHISSDICNRPVSSNMPISIDIEEKRKIVFNPKHFAEVKSILENRN